MQLTLEQISGIGPFIVEKLNALGIFTFKQISNMTPEFGATAAMFYIDDNTLDYLRLTGREEEQGGLRLRRGQAKRE